MGNLFAGQDESGAKHGAENDEGNSYVTHEEVKVLRSCYESLTLPLSPADPTAPTVPSSLFDLDRVKSAFGSGLLGDVILLRLTKFVHDYANFEQFIIDCTRVSASNILETFWSMVVDYSPDGSNEERLKMLYILIIESSQSIASTMNNAEINQNLSSDDVDSLAAQQVEFFTSTQQRYNSRFTLADGELELSTILSGINNYSAYAAKVLETHVSHVVYRGLLTQSPSYKPFIPPIVFTLPPHSSKTLDSSLQSEDGSNKSELNTDVNSKESQIVGSLLQLLPLALYNHSLQGQWTRLYSTSFDGISFNRIVHHLLGYDGPTCFLIRTRGASPNVFGALAIDRWKEQNIFFGSSKNILFTLSPKLRIYRSKGSHTGSYQWLNTKAFSLPHGLGFGGSTDGFRLFIPDSLEGCTARASDTTYESGPLLRIVESTDNNSYGGGVVTVGTNNGAFEIDTLEVWGCGGAEVVADALLAQEEERQVVNDNIRKARMVDKAAFFNNEFDREFFLGNTMSHRADIQSRSGNA